MEGRNIGIFAGARQNLHIGLGFIFADIIKGCLAAGMAYPDILVFLMYLTVDFQKPWPAVLLRGQ